MNLVDQINIINNIPVEVEPHEPVPPRIKGLILTNLNESDSTYAARKCGISIEKTKSEIDYCIFPATTPSTVARDLKKISYLDSPESLPWTWPTKKEDEGIDFKTGLYKYFEADKDPAKLISNTVTHMKAWQYCIDINQPIIIMDSHVNWTRKFDSFDDNNGPFKGGIVNMKIPAIGTKGIQGYTEELDKRPSGLGPLMSIAKVGSPQQYHPQHIVDSGTYMITPWAAKKLLDQIQDNGMWPEYILMNKQLFSWIQLVSPHYTQ